MTDSLAHDDRDRMDQLFARARRTLPGGVSSPVRAFGSVGGTPVFVASAQGPYLTDANGARYVDLVCSWGPALLGHAHPEVVARVQEAAARGLSFGAPTELEVRLAELIRERVPFARRVRFVSTGTEATMTAVRLARGATGRALIVKFAGCYHGHSDALLAAAGSGLATAGLPGSAGVTSGASADTLVLAYNDAAALEQVFAERGREIAAVITEPAAANMGIVPPEPGFNATIRRLCTDHGAMMIADEVLTGFRVSAAGWWGLEREQWTPDLVTFGKVVGGGMPLAAIGGASHVMELLAPTGPVYQAGTLSGNPLATTAGIATLELADAAVYARVDEASDWLQDRVRDALDAVSVAYRLQSAGSLFSVFFGDEVAAAPVVDYAAAQRQEAWRFSAFFHAMLDAGVALPPSGFEAWFLSAAHDDAALAHIERALPAAARAAAAATTEQ